MADDTKSKSFLGLLNGLVRQKYYGNDEITEEFLKSELYPDSSDAEFSNIASKCLTIIRTLASADMDFNQLEAYLTSQTKKKEGGLTEDQAKIVTKFWKNHKTRVHEAIVSKTVWGTTLKNCSWRIDIKSQAKHIDQLNIPTAIVELELEDKTSFNKKTDVVRFEMDDSKLQKMLTNLQEIENEIKKHCQD